MTWGCWPFTLVPLGFVFPVRVLWLLTVLSHNSKTDSANTDKLFNILDSYDTYYE